MENSIEGSQNVKNWMAIWSSNLTSEDLFKENKSTDVKRYMNSHVCCSAIYSSQKWKQQKDPVSDEWTNKMWCVYQFSLVHSLCHVRLFVTPWTAAHQASWSITNSWSLLKLLSIKSMVPSNHLILCRPLLLLPLIPPSIKVFSNESTLRNG